METVSLSRTKVAGAHILYDAARLNQPGNQHFDPQWWQQNGRLSGEAKGRGSAYFLNGEDGEWVLRHFLRGGLVGKLNHDRYLFTGLERTRPFREARLLAWMRERELPVPTPIAARVVSAGPCYRGDLIMAQLSGRPLAKMLVDGSADSKIFVRVGQLIRRFHEYGIFHADLNAHNILVDDARVHLIDFDRGAVRRPGRWQRRNLDRLQRSISKILGARWASETQWQQGWLALEKGYRESSIN